MPEKLTQIAAVQRPPFVARRDLLRTPQAASSRARNEAVCGCRLSPEIRGSPILRPPDPGIRCGGPLRTLAFSCCFCENNWLYSGNGRRKRCPRLLPTGLYFPNWLVGSTGVVH